MIMNKFKLSCSLLVLIFTLINCKQSLQSNKYVQDSISNVNIEEKMSCLEIQPDFNFGKIDKNRLSIIEINLEFSNIGETPLVIMKTDVSCGCMTVDYTKHPIQKGDKGFLNVKINTTNQSGFFNKSIIIKSNAQNNIEIVRIKGYIQ